MSNIQTGAERMPHDLSHLGFLAGQIGRLITISTTPVIAGDSFEMDAVGALRLSPLRRGLAIDSTVDIFTFYVPHRHVYGEQWIKFMKDGVNVTPLPTVNTTGYIGHAAFLGTINTDTNKIPKHLFQGYLNIYTTILKRRGWLTVPRLTLMSLIKVMLVMVSVAAISKTYGLLRFLLRLTFLARCRLLPHLLTLWACKLLMLICILTKNVITPCSVTMMLLLHLEVKPLMTLTTVLYLSCALISGHLAMMLMELTKRR